TTRYGLLSYFLFIKMTKNVSTTMNIIVQLEYSHLVLGFTSRKIPRQQSLKWSILVHWKKNIEAIFIYDATRNFHETERIFNERFPNRPICRKYLRKLVSKFTTTGSVHNKKPPGHPSI
ncbi:DUF4817 domain-containing protein, partial [Staphylococcus aureus]|nr:DUF4817 domain-containing protein [Staphylococcus aureus]